MRLFLSLLLSLVFLCSAQTALAASITLSAPAQVTVGSSFRVIASSGGAIDVDTMRLEGTFPSNLVAWVAGTPGGILTNTSPGNTFDQTNGTFSFGAFSLADRLNGAKPLATLTFRANKIGKATIQLVPGSHLLSAGVEEASSFGQVTVSIVAPTAPVPTTPSAVPAEPSAIASLHLRSSSHPNQDAWSKDPNVVLTWDRRSDAIKNVYVGFDQNPGGPADQVQVNGTALRRATKDGIWYVHFGVSFKDGTYQQQDYRIMIDRQAPHALTPTVDQTGVLPTVPNYLRFGTTDDTSGVKSYEINLDGKTVTTTVMASYPLTNLAAGHHNVTVKASDYAGNTVSGKTSFDLAKAPAPTPTAAAPKPQQVARDERPLFIAVFVTFTLALLFCLAFCVPRRPRTTWREK